MEQPLRWGIVRYQPRSDCDPLPRRKKKKQVATRLLRPGLSLFLTLSANFDELVAVNPDQWSMATMEHRPMTKINIDLITPPALLVICLE